MVKDLENVYYINKAKYKKIYNPVTKKYYLVRQKTTKKSSKGEIKGLWSSKYNKKD